MSIGLSSFEFDGIYPDIYDDDEFSKTFTSATKSTTHLSIDLESSEIYDDESVNIATTTHAKLPFLENKNEYDEHDENSISTRVIYLTIAETTTLSPSSSKTSKLNTSTTVERTTATATTTTTSETTVTHSYWRFSPTEYHFGDFLIYTSTIDPAKVAKYLAKTSEKLFRKYLSKFKKLMFIYLFKIVIVFSSKFLLLPL